VALRVNDHEQAVRSWEIAETGLEHVDSASRPPGLKLSGGESICTRCEREQLADLAITIA
jgi:hypothetical protein